MRAPYRDPRFVVPGALLLLLVVILFTTRRERQMQARYDDCDARLELWLKEQAAAQTGQYPSFEDLGRWLRAYGMELERNGDQVCIEDLIDYLHEHGASDTRDWRRAIDECLYAMGLDLDLPRIEIRNASR